MGKDETEAALGAAPFLFRVGKVDDSKFDVPPVYTQGSRGYTWQALVDRSTGSLHVGVDVCRLDPGGHVDDCLRAHETGIYLLTGELELKIGGEAFRLAADDYALIPYETVHAVRNVSGAPARWFEMQAPQPKPPGAWQDTIFPDRSEWPHVAERLRMRANNHA
jgi:quercetin dioxygenase-like cupin family protein